jgi:hypothetical protein
MAYITALSNNALACWIGDAWGASDCRPFAGRVAERQSDARPARLSARTWLRDPTVSRVKHGGSLRASMPEVHTAARGSDETDAGRRTRAGATRHT